MPRENVATRLSATSAKSDTFERFGDAFFAFGKTKTDQPGGVAKIVGGRRVVIETDGVRHVADPALDRERLARRIEAEHTDLAAGNIGQAEQHQDRGGLARTIRTEETEYLPAPDVERDVIDCDGLAVFLGEAGGLNHFVITHRRPNLATAPTMTSNATPIMPTPAMPHIVEVVTVTRNVVDADSPRAAARTVVT